MTTEDKFSKLIELTQALLGKPGKLIIHAQLKLEVGYSSSNGETSTSASWIRYHTQPQEIICSIGEPTNGGIVSGTLLTLDEILSDLLAKMASKLEKKSTEHQDTADQIRKALR